MRGIEFAEVRDAIARAFNADEFDMFLYERLDFDRSLEIPDGPFRVVVTNVLKKSMQEGWDPILISEVAAVRPLKQDIQDVYRKYAAGLVDESHRQAVEANLAKSLDRFGLAPKVDLQNAGAFEGAAVSAAGAGFEKAVKQLIPQLNVGLWRENLLRLESRVCRVEVGNGDMGTGFLVGPDVLLTNYHVLKQVIDGKSPASAVRFRFDYRVLSNGLEFEGVLASLHPTDWKLDFSKYTEPERLGTPDAALPTTDELDYAFVRLDRPVGSTAVNTSSTDSPLRGWIALPNAPQPLVPKLSILILHHPLKQPLKLALDTEAVLKVNGNGTRVRYTTNTEAGSSGSPCFDMNWNLVALHHYGDPAYGQQPKYNQGIPIGMIRDRLERTGQTAVLGGPSPA